MEDRLLRLLDTEQLSSSKFADVIGVQRSSVSHILSGRNKPSFDFLQKTLSAFPHVSADWLILGKGKMYESLDVAVGGNLFDQPGQSSPVNDEKIVNETPDTEELSPSELNISAITDNISSKEGSEREKINAAVQPKDSGSKIERVILIYSDKTFVSYNPAD